MAGYGCLTVDQRATVVVLFAEIKGITTTQGDCGLFFKLDGHQQETLCFFEKFEAVGECEGGVRMLQMCSLLKLCKQP
jgi:hypothetical protein